LVPESKIKFPAIPGVHSPLTIHNGYRADLGGSPSAHPLPLLVTQVDDDPIHNGYRADLGGSPSAHPLPLLVTQVDDDGNELSGIRLPNVSVPLATYTGWNFRSPAIGQPDELLPLTGSFIPFPVTKQDREKASDPRPSIEERYEGRDQYRTLVTDAAMKLVRQGYVLEADVPGVVERALANWETLTRGTSLAGK
jgi:hypothetical protein